MRDQGNNKSNTSDWASIKPTTTEEVVDMGDGTGVKVATNPPPQDPAKANDPILTMASNKIVGWLSTLEKPHAGNDDVYHIDYKSAIT